MSFDPYKQPIAPLKRFLVFSYESYYPGGGWSDFLGSYDTAEAAYIAHEYADDVIDTTTGQHVRRADANQSK